jgi:hypothetical protein
MTHGNDRLTFTISIPASAIVYVAAGLLIVIALVALAMSVKLYVCENKTAAGLLVASVAFAALGFAVGAVWTYDLALALRFAAFMAAWLLICVCLWAAVYTTVTWLKTVTWRPHMPKVEFRLSRLGAHRAA